MVDLTERELLGSVLRQRPVVLIGGLNLSRCLGQAGIPVIFATAKHDDLALSSRHAKGRVALPAGGETRQTAQALLQAGRRLHRMCGAPVPLFYGGDDEIKVAAEHRAALQEHFLLLTSSPELDLALLDKQQTYDLLARHRLPAPRGYSWQGPGSFREAPGPLIVKPTIKTNWVESDVFQHLFGSEGKARIYDSAAQLGADGRAWDHRERLLVQDYIPGGDDAILSFHGLADEQGQVMASFCGRKIRTFPAGTGESCYIELIHHRELSRLGCEVVRRLGLAGPVKIDTKVHRDTGEIVIMEINTRFTIWNYLGAANGINLPAMAHDYLVYGRRPGRVSYRTRYRWLEPYLDYRAFCELNAAGELSLGRWVGSLMAPKVQDLFCWSDPAPFVKGVWRFTRATVNRWLSA